MKSPLELQSETGQHLAYQLQTVESLQRQAEAILETFKHSHIQENASSGVVYQASKDLYAGLINLSFELTQEIEDCERSHAKTQLTAV